MDLKTLGPGNLVHPVRAIHGRTRLRNRPPALHCPGLGPEASPGFRRSQPAAPDAPRIAKVIAKATAGNWSPGATAIENVPKENGESSP